MCYQGYWQQVTDQTPAQSPPLLPPKYKDWTQPLFSGFHLSGEIVPGRVSQSQAFTSTEQEIKYKVSVSFDR